MLLKGSPWTLRENTNHDDDGCNDNYDGNFDDNDDKNDQKSYKY